MGGCALTPWQDMPINPDTGIPYTPRDWQAEALPAIGSALRAGESPLVIAATGAGKSVLQAEVCRLFLARLGDGAIVVSAPSQSLVVQLSATIAGRCGADAVGVFYGRKKQPRRRVIVVCLPSLPNLAIELAAQGRSVALLIVDEAHKAETEAVIDAVFGLEPKRRIGFTATPFRSVEEEALSLWTSIAYRYTLGDAWDSGALVPLVVKTWDGPDGLTPVDDACISMIRRFTEGPGVVSATSIADAEAYAERLTSEGIAAVAVHSKLPAGGLAEARERLKAGEIRCVVHVSLLTEGIDWPFLRWGCLRRPRRATVGFVQEVGRFLRTSPGKTEAVLLDPHMLFDSTPIGMAVQTGGDFAERLGAWEAELLEAETRPRETLEGDPEIKELPPAKAVHAAMRWARDTLLSLQSAGVISADMIESGPWRVMPATERQTLTLTKMSKSYRRYTPEAIADGLAVLAKETASTRLQRGAVSDLITILNSVANQAPGYSWEDRKGWAGVEWPDGLDLPILEANAARGMRRDPDTGRLVRA